MFVQLKQISFYSMQWKAKIMWQWALCLQVLTGQKFMFNDSPCPWYSICIIKFKHLNANGHGCSHDSSQYLTDKSGKHIFSLMFTNPAIPLLYSSVEERGASDVRIVGSIPAGATHRKMYASTALDVSAKRHIIPKNLYRLGYSHVTLSMYDQEVKLHHM